ncbi:MAG TPA: nuclear transport factor 2 family protein [Chitinophagaceae bacterium]|nr:nuclear transport factor 2 family protein [Chitinophagaceae bacterium]
MKRSFIILKFISAVIIFLSGGNLITGQEKNDSSRNSDLYKEIARMDSILFGAFNARDIEKFKALFTGDLEFYHDKGGLTNYDHTINFMKATASSGSDLKRNLIKESLEVYPIPGYGAIETGTHTFCHSENGKQDCGTFKFVHIWQKTSGEWKISRVVSYAH